METRASETASMLRENGLSVALLGGGPRFTGTYTELACISRDSLLLGGPYSPIPWSRRVKIEETTFANTLMKKLSKLAPRDRIYFVFQRYIANRLQRAKDEGRLTAPIVVTNGFTRRPQNLRHFDFVHVLAPFYLERARQSGIDTSRWYFAPQPVNTELFRPLPSLAVRNYLGISSDDFVVLVVGAINSTKGIDYAAREVGHLAIRHPRIKLLVVGQTEQETPGIMEYARSKLSSNVIFRTARHEIMPYVYSAGDVSVLPTQGDVAGNVFTESMACGIPVVGPEFAVTKWIIGDGGDTADMKGNGQLAALLEVYLQDCSYRLARARQARLRAINYFSTKVVAPQYMKMLESIMNEVSGHSKRQG